MKTFRFLMAALLAATMLPLQAQRPDIEAAFQRLVTHPKATVIRTVSYDGEQGNVRPVLEVYTFQIKRKYHKLVDDIVQTLLGAYSDPKCYRVESFAANGVDKPRAWDILYGESASQKVEIGRKRHYNYAFINLADNSPEAQGNYRTCYAVEWIGPKVGGVRTRFIEGKLIKTYARIPQATAALDMVVDTAMDIVVDTALYTMLSPLNTMLSPLNTMLSALAENNPLLMFAQLRTQFYEAKDVSERTAICTMLYDTAKHMVRRGMTTADERTLMINQLKDMVRSCAQDRDGRSFADYLRLAIKVLETNSVP